LGPEALAQVLRPLQMMFAPSDCPDLLVGLGSPDDAAVYRISDERALIVTTDFFTPIVDDPAAYGTIAAANALSDVYAMGGQPVFALNIAALPNDLPDGMATTILRAMAEKVREAGAVIAGGHSIQDKEPKVGLVAVGMASPSKLLTKGGARAGDVLVLTKPLGTGCITTGAKRGLADQGHIDHATEWMTRLNREAAEAATEAGARAATDITGYGLLGHATEMAQAGGVTLRIEADRIPLLQGAADYAERDIFPGGARTNQTAYQAGVHFADGIDSARQMLLFDPQTSGGLLLALPPERVTTFDEVMQRGDQSWWTIGEVLASGDMRIDVVM